MKSRLRPLAALAVVALIGAGCSDENGTDSGGGKTNATNREQAVKFAQCMRRNGVSEFPDPDASGDLTVDGVVNGSSLDPGAPAWKAAMGACKDLEPSGFTGHQRSAEQQQSALAFAQCMRDNGVEDFPDPTADGPLVDTRRIPSAAGSWGMATLNATMQKCGDESAGAGVTQP